MCVTVGTTARHTLYIINKSKGLKLIPTINKYLDKYIGQKASCKHIDLIILISPNKYITKTNVFINIFKKTIKQGTSITCAHLPPEDTCKGSFWWPGDLSLAL